MRVTLSINSSWNVLNFRKTLVSALLADGHAVTILAPYEPEARQLEAMGCRVVHLEMDRKGLSPFRDLALFFRLLRHFRHERPDVILSYTIKNNIYGAFAGKLLGIAFIPNVTGLGTIFIRTTLATRIAISMYRLAFRKLDRIFFQNGDDRDLFIEQKIVDPRQTAILPGSGIDLDRFVPRALPSRDGVVFLLIGRMLRDKGVCEFVDAARTVRALHPTARFQLLGFLDADNRSAIDERTMTNWVNENIIEYLGSASDVRPAIKDADCIVLPSYREGAPRTLIEGAAMGRPTIATDVPGCRDVVEDGATGLLCRVRDADDLAVKMIRMIEMGADRRMAMGQAGRRKMEREYDQAIVAEAYRGAIDEVASAQAMRRS
jgi:glycosyltransferase involved in cell wall biosynthesis